MWSNQEMIYYFCWIKFTKCIPFLPPQDRKDRERAQALELQQQIQAQLNDTALADDITEKLKKLAPALEPERTDDDQAVLLAKLLVGFAPEKAAQMMTVRKGKVDSLRIPIDHI